VVTKTAATEFAEVANGMKSVYLVFRHDLQVDPDRSVFSVISVAI